MPHSLRWLVAAPARVGLIIWTVLAIAPFLLILALSMRSNRDIYAFPFGIGGSYRLDNYVDAWRGPVGVGMSDYMWNTAVSAFIGVLVALLAGSIAAFWSTHLTQRGRNLFLVVFLLAQVVPFVFILIPYYQAFNALFLLSQPWALGVAYGALALPTVVMVMHPFYADFPSEILEASAVDGVSEFRSFFLMVLPLSKAALVASGLLVLIFIWGEAQLGVVILQDPASQTVSVGMLNYQGTFTVNLGAQFAGLSIATIPLIVIYLVFQRYVTKGIALGGVSR